jgi:hypothetical protein
MEQITKVTIDDIVYSKEAYQGDWEKFLLNSIPEYDIVRYAEYNLGLISEDDCECDELDTSDFDDKDLIEEAEKRGMIFIKTNSIIDTDLIKEAINNLGL